MDKNKIKETLKAKLKQEMSMTGTGASMTSGGDFIATKYAFGKSNNKGTPKDWKAAPSIPNRKSKAMDYKELWEVNLKKSKLSPKEYQEAKKLKDFKSEDWKWDAKQDLYVKSIKEIAMEVTDDLDAIKQKVISWSKSRRNAKQDSLEINWWKHFDDTIMNATTKDEIKKAILDMYYMGDFNWSELGLGEAYDKAKIKTNTDELARVEDMLKTASTSQMSAQESRIKKLKLLVGLEKKYKIELPVLHYGTDWSDYLKKQNVKTSRELEDKLSSKKESMNEETLEEAYIPDNIKKFAQRKGVTSVVNQVARWVEKMGKNIVGGTAIGKDYSTLILDLTYQGGQIRINTDTDEIEVRGEEVYDYNSFVNALGDDKVNENIERDQKVKIVKGTHAGNTAIVHDFDSEKDTVSGDDWVDVLIGDKKEKKTVKASELKPLNENYARFRNETKTRTKPEQFHNAVKSVKQKVNEINRLFEYMNRLQSELSESEGGLKHKKYTDKAIQSIKESTKQLFFKSTKLK